MASNVNNSSQLASHPNPSRQFFVTLIAISRMEMTTGKLSTAINTVLLLALALILESNVREDAKPSAVRNITTAKMNLSSTGLPKRS